MTAIVLDERGYRRLVSVQWRDIRTERLLLRPLRPDDRDDVVAIQTDPRTHCHDPAAPTRGEADVKFTAWLEHWNAHGFGYLAVLPLGSAELIGVGGLQHTQFDGLPLLNLYYRLRPTAWGRGYATELASAVVEWAERDLPGLPVQISVHTTNEPSLRVAERLGFTVCAESFSDGTTSQHFRKPR
ncbi:GNAT family N-acetyltransferase [Amycolatopsis viridis]|uniref:RimJ/RimL family protein N-acetyltransferase n=1 Tax=Amycolatopsis viridis TaxID=185678 RepID=A0ABX0T0A9_9PSEU|nr:GNAT family N-acetyltransferase [Amycolatopsis viridis]NIH82059.1 RimJ/RimL family protein N-acetyltransferase [Amycolatopsis viridis]